MDGPCRLPFPRRWEEKKKKNKRWDVNFLTFFFPSSIFTKFEIDWKGPMALSVYLSFSFSFPSLSLLLSDSPFPSFVLSDDEALSYSTFVKWFWESILTEFHKCYQTLAPHRPNN